MGETSDRGARKESLGSIKEALGKVIGNERVEAEGAAQKAAGKAEGDRKNKAQKNEKSRGA